jgi:hypothetical protein
MWKVQFSNLPLFKDCGRIEDCGDGVVGCKATAGVGTKGFLVGESTTAFESLFLLDMALLIYT